MQPDCCAACMEKFDTKFFFIIILFTFFPSNLTFSLFSLFFFFAFPEEMKECCIVFSYLVVKLVGESLLVSRVSLLDGFVFFSVCNAFLIFSLLFYAFTVLHILHIFYIYSSPIPFLSMNY